MALRLARGSHTAPAGIEMVDYVVRTSEGSADHVFSMLERLGFRVGQRLAEKYRSSPTGRCD